MGKFIKAVNSITIRVPGHNGQSSKVTSTSAIIPTSGIMDGETQLVADGDSGTWTCPICGGLFKFSIIGNCPIIFGQSIKLCQEGAQYEIDHGASFISESVVLSSISCGQ